MEQHGHPSQPQYASGSYVGQQTPHTSAQAPGRQYAPLSSSGRFQQQPPSDGQPAPAAPAPLGRVGSTAPQVYGFPPGAPQYGSVSGLPSDSMQYAPNLHAPAPQRPMQQSQYQPYGGGGNGNGGVGNVMYGIAQPQSQQQPPQPAAASAYEPGSSSYRQRPHAASDTLATFGVPPAGAQYYLSGSTVSTATSAAPDLAAQQAPSQYQPRAHHAHAGPSTQPSYASTLVDASRSGVGAPFAPPSTYESQTPVPSIDQIFRDYQTRIRTVFTLAYEGSLRGIDTHLLQIAERLLGSAEALGLTRDEESLRDDRIRLWDEFNRAWLVTLQRQYDMTAETIRTGHAPREPRSLMTVHALEHLSEELMRLCNAVERHGLVDFQMGVAEAEIIDLLLRCLALLDPARESSGGGAPGRAPLSTPTAPGRR